jgi:hypothetical protein
MVCFQTKNRNLGKFLRALEWKMLVFIMTIWNILRPFGIPNLWPFVINCGRLVYFSRFGMFGPRKIWQPCVRRLHYRVICTLNLSPLSSLPNGLTVEQCDQTRLCKVAQKCSPKMSPKVAQCLKCQKMSPNKKCRPSRPKNVAKKCSPARFFW